MNRPKVVVGGRRTEAIEDVQPATRPAVDHAPILCPPPLLFFVALGATWLLDHLVPVPLHGLSGTPSVIAAAVPAVVSLALAGWAWATMRRARTPVDPYRPTLRIVSSGPFRLTRNPLYVALVLLLLGFTALMDAAWGLAFAAVLVLALDLAVVRREERYLEGRFGEEYRGYRRRVRRWL